MYSATSSSSSLLPSFDLPPQTDTIIMDDPLSALDATTSAYVSEEAILKSMKHLTRILVTHQKTQVLSHYDRIIWMEHGSIKAVGTFREVLESEPAFRRFVGEKGQSSSRSEDASEVTTDVKVFSPEEEGEDLMIEEERQKDRIPWSVYAHYTYFPWSLWYYVMMFWVYAVSQVLNVGWGILFAWWSSNAFNLGNFNWIIILVANSIAHITLWLGTFLGSQQALTHCSEHTGNRALEGVLRSSMTFFDTTPIGRILNRFTQASPSRCQYREITSNMTKDINMLDLMLPAMGWSVIMGSFTTITVIAFTIHYVPFVSILVVPWISIAVLIALFYRPAPLAIKRIEAPLASQIISHISELVNGASVLRTSPFAE